MSNGIMWPKHSSWRWSCLLLVFSSRSSGIALTDASNPHVVHRLPRIIQSVPMGGASSGAFSLPIETTKTPPSNYTIAAPNSTTVFSSLNLECSTPTNTDIRRELLSESRQPLKILFLSSDTGGGHRASAEALAKQFLLHFPNSTYDTVDVWTLDGVYPYNALVRSYKHLSAHPQQWRFLYHFSNARIPERLIDLHSDFLCQEKIRRRIESYNPDIIVSVHPTMNRTPLISTKRISKAFGRHIPFFTVVTDLGSGHCTWFQENVDKIYVASDQIRRLAKIRGRVPDDNIVMSGLPIRHDFAVHAEAMGDRMSARGKEYQRKIRQELNLSPDKQIILAVGGGEGVGGLSKIVNELHAELSSRGMNATICAVCGRNEKLQKELATRDWNKLLTREQRFKRLFRRGRKQNRKAVSGEITEESLPPRGNVDVVGLGFVENMADYMVAADVVVTKAGPGTIAEAAAVGLPVMLTSFLPGQEAGNVAFVLEAGFGGFQKKPSAIAQEVALWLGDKTRLEIMSHAAKSAGHPHAASDIVLDMGNIALTWKALNDGNASAFTRQ